MYDVAIIGAGMASLNAALADGLARAFTAEDALQCGYCTPGQIMSALGLVRENRAHTDAEVREHMSGTGTS